MVIRITVKYSHRCCGNGLHFKSIRCSGPSLALISLRLSNLNAMSSLHYLPCPQKGIHFNETLLDHYSLQEDRAVHGSVEQWNTAYAVVELKLQPLPDGIVIIKENHNLWNCVQVRLLPNCWDTPKKPKLVLSFPGVNHSRLCSVVVVWWSLIKNL